MVRIPAFHAGGPGSIPGVGNHFPRPKWMLCISYPLWLVNNHLGNSHVQYQIVQMVICIYHVSIKHKIMSQGGIRSSKHLTRGYRFLVYANFTGRLQIWLADTRCNKFLGFFFPPLIVCWLIRCVFLFFIHLTEFAFLMKGLHLLGLWRVSVAQSVSAFGC